MIDLHVHSNYSDGSCDVREIAEIAVDLNLKAIALTDHDRVDGVDELKNLLMHSQVELVSGMEISVQCGFDNSVATDKSAHILLYFIDPNNSDLIYETKKLQQDRETRNDRLIESLNSCGVKVTLEDIALIAKNKGIGRPHFARYLVDNRYCSTMDEAFVEYLGTTGRAYIPKARLNLNDGVRIAKMAGGLAVLAHPFTVSEDLTELDDLFGQLKEIGFEGIEAYYGRYTKTGRKSLIDLAQEHGLVATGGSDFHGSFKADLFIGTGTGDLAVDDSILDLLKARL